MRTAEAHDMRFPSVASVKSKLFTHDLNGLGPAGLKILGPMYWLPKHPHVFAGQGAGTCWVTVHIVNVGHHLLLLEAKLFSRYQNIGELPKTSILAFSS
jgi:hypothetical protein